MSDKAFLPSLGIFALLGGSLLGLLFHNPYWRIEHALRHQYLAELGSAEDYELDVIVDSCGHFMLSPWMGHIDPALALSIQRCAHPERKRRKAL